MKTNSSLRNFTMAALSSGLICLATAYLFHIPYGVNGGYIHIGDAIIYLTACILPTPYAIAAAALGGALADLLTAPLWAPATLIIKSLLVLTFTSKHAKIVKPRNIIALFLSGIITILGYYFAEIILFGDFVALASMVGNLIQSVASGLIFIVFGTALDKMHFKAKQTRGDRS